MPTRSGILAGGNWIVDHVKMIDVYPAQDALANIADESPSNGGGPFNLLADLARMGVSFPLQGVGLTGDDEAGRWIRERCDELRIDATRLTTTSEAPTSYTDVMTVRSTGRRTFFHQRGANALLGPEQFDLASSDARLFHLGYLLLLDRLDAPDAKHGTVAAALLAQAREAGFKTSIDLVSEDSGRFREVAGPSLRHSDYAVMNEFEAERLTGLDLRSGDRLDAANVRRAAARLKREGVGEWVVIHFPEGAIACGRDHETLGQGSVLLPPASIAGAAGAGDAFAAGLLFGLHEDVPIDQCLRYGVCVAAACLSHATTSGGVRPLADCQRLGDEFGYRPTP
ncbi:MAG: carbohydrate kinase family protein [Planctomycetaceae bacterium]